MVVGVVVCELDGGLVVLLVLVTSVDDADEVPVDSLVMLK